MQRFIKGIGVFVLTLSVCAALLTGVCGLIPQSAIERNMQRAEAYFSANEGFPQLSESMPLLRMDNYADCALFNVIYHVDAQNPLHSVIAAPYYRIEGNDIRQDFRAGVVDGLPANNEYSRYWHGSQVLIRPLLTFTSVEGCRLILFGMLLGLNLWLAVRLIRMRRVRVLLIYGAALLAVHFWASAFTIEYITMFLVMSAACIAAAGLWRKERHTEWRVRRMTTLMIISGTAACFLDFLTAETLTLTVPVLLWLLLYKENDQEPLRMKQMLGWLLRFGAAWLAAYAFTFAVKWALVYVFMGPDALENVFSSAAYRIDRSVIQGEADSAMTVRTRMIPVMLAHNIGMLFPFAASYPAGTVLGIAGGLLAVLLAVLYLFRGAKTDGVLITGLLLTGLVPYARMLVLTSHSLDHFFFTYRAQMAAVMALIAVLAYSLKPSEVLGKKRRKARR